MKTSRKFSTLLFNVAIAFYTLSAANLVVYFIDKEESIFKLGPTPRWIDTVILAAIATLLLSPRIIRLMVTGFKQAFGDIPFKDFKKELSK